MKVKKERNNNYVSNINIKKKKNYLAMYGFSATRG